MSLRCFVQLPFMFVCVSEVPPESFRSIWIYCENDLSSLNNVFLEQYTKQVRNAEKLGPLITD